jgi:hypothetical protein
VTPHSPTATEPTFTAPQAVHGPHSAREWAYEVDRLTTALHAAMNHPDFTYLATFGATPLPPSAQWGAGWEPNPEVGGHGTGHAPRLTWWWRRLLADGETP